MDYEKIPEIDLRKLDHITSLATTFENKELKTKNVLNFYYDSSRDYIFLEVKSELNGKTIADDIFGFDKDKLLSTSENLIKYFCKDDVEFLNKYFMKNANN
jgi:hypothetical protein